MASSAQSNPSDATDAFFMPDWNQAAGDGVTVPDNRNRTQSLEEIYGDARQGEKDRLS